MRKFYCQLLIFVFIATSVFAQKETIRGHKIKTYGPQQAVNDTTYLKAMSADSVGDRVFLQGLSQKNPLGGGVFVYWDSTDSQGFLENGGAAFNCSTQGKQWIREEVLNGDWVNPRWWGARSYTDSTVWSRTSPYTKVIEWDQTPYFQKAIQFARLTTHKMRIPSGVFYVDSLVIPSYMRVWGDVGFSGNPGSEPIRNVSILKPLSGSTHPVIIIADTMAHASYNGSLHDGYVAGVDIGYFQIHAGADINLATYSATTGIRVHLTSEQVRLHDIKIMYAGKYCLHIASNGRLGGEVTSLNLDHIYTAYGEKANVYFDTAGSGWATSINELSMDAWGPEGGIVARLGGQETISINGLKMEAGSTSGFGKGPHVRLIPSYAGGDSLKTGNGHMSISGLYADTRQDDSSAVVRIDHEVPAVFSVYPTVSIRGLITPNANVGKGEKYYKAFKYVILDRCRNDTLYADDVTWPAPDINWYNGTYTRNVITDSLKSRVIVPTDSIGFSGGTFLRGFIQSGDSLGFKFYNNTEARIDTCWAFQKN